MRFAAPAQRLRLPQPPHDERHLGVQDASRFGADCPQQNASVDWTSALPGATLQRLASNSDGGVAQAQSEDCLLINVHAPTAAVGGRKKLPVVVWIFGGGFEDGEASIYDGTVVARRSIEVGEPMLYVSMGYRTNAFGFLSGKEMKDAGLGNIGLWDQRAALDWVQQHIEAFGGDPRRVTIWGQSAGAISVSLQMIHAAYTSSPAPFRAGWMNSGSPTISPPMDDAAGQNVYDTVVAGTNCTGARDTIQCLREAPYETFLAAMQTNVNIFSFQSLNLTYRPRVDGNFLKESPVKSVQEGRFAKVPIVSGDCDDEGTLFALTITNLTTTPEVFQYLKQSYIPKATASQIAKLEALYPNSSAAGSPFNTGTANEIAPEFKRLSAIQGDFVFQAPRRFFLSQAVKTQPVWSYLSKKLKDTAVLGAWHSTDLIEFYPNAENGGDNEGLDRLINFVTTLDPNQGKKLSGPRWPKYDLVGKRLLEFSDAANGTGTSLSLTRDTYREEAMAEDIALMIENL